MTRTNAHLVRTIFHKTAHPVVLDQRYKIKKPTAPVTVGGGWHPGWSTDYVATVLAYDFGAAEVIVAGSPDHVYNKDPRKYKNAVPLPQLSWKGITARSSRPSGCPVRTRRVDPVAARFGAEKGMQAIIVNGKDLKNFDALLKGKEFKGTIIS